MAGRKLADEPEMELEKPPPEPNRLRERKFVPQSAVRKPTPVRISTISRRLILVGVLLLVASILLPLIVSPAGQPA